VGEKPKCIIVTGVPYSGKAIIAGVLHHLGIYMGEYSIRGKENFFFYGPYDGYEDAYFIDFHLKVTGTRHDHDILSKIRMCADDNKIFTYHVAEPNSADEKENVLYEAIVTGLDFTEARIISNCETYPIWGLQEPRLCIPQLFHDFVGIVEQYAEPMLVVADRSLVDSAKSYDLDDINYVLESLVVYQSVRNEIFYGFEGKKKMVSFDDTVFEPIEVVNNLAEFAEVEPTESAYGFLLERKQFLINNECWFSEADKYRKMLLGGSR
jgi:hypothetical protein